jgi:hypothetical protein
MEDYFWQVFGALFLIFGAMIGAVWYVQKRQGRTVPSGGPAPRTDPNPHPATTRTAGANDLALLRSAAGGAPGGDVRAHPLLWVNDPLQSALDLVRPGLRLLHLIAPRDRRHTAIAGKTGDGKTATLNTLLVADVAAEAHCIVCNTHFTAYHPEDQPIDLRPIMHLFEVAYEVPAIQAVLARVIAELGRRMELYRNGQDVGQDIVLYVGEWGAIKRTLGADAVDQVVKLLDEGRKTRIWLVVEYHSLLVSRTGGDSALREMYTTVLAGNVDPTTWKFAVGDAIEPAPVALGTWMTDKGLMRVVRPTAEDIAYLAPRQSCIVSSVLAPAAPVAAEEDPTLLRLFAQVDARKQAETAPQSFRPAETPVSPVATPKNEDDSPFRNVDFAPLARLVRAGIVTETKCLETAFGVKPGSSKEYQAVRAGLKKALQELEGNT